jgi:hypothetical protein
VTTWKGPVDEKFLHSLKEVCAKRILDMAKEEEKGP